MVRVGVRFFECKLHGNRASIKEEGLGTRQDRLMLCWKLASHEGHRESSKPINHNFLFYGLILVMLPENANNGHSYIQTLHF